MFDFLKPEVSGIKNVIISYFAYKQHNEIQGDIPLDQMDRFAEWYFNFRLGPPLVSPSDAYRMQNIARENLKERHTDHITLLDILYALMASEGMGGRSLDISAIKKVFSKFPSISAANRGLS